MKQQSIPTSSNCCAVNNNHVLSQPELQAANRQHTAPTSAIAPSNFVKRCAHCIFSSYNSITNLQANTT
jgi:hypothetical protein